MSSISVVVPPPPPPEPPPPPGLPPPVGVSAAEYSVNCVTLKLRVPPT